MAVDRISPPVATPPSSGPAASRLEAAREAQRAFFNAALTGEAAPPPTVARPAATAPVAATAPDGRLRPGSLVDIKV